MEFGAEMVIEKKDLRELFPDNILNLEQLAEEASKVIQAKSKVVRFGLKDTFNDTLNPDQTNQEKLEAEIGQFLAVVDVLVETGILRQDKLDAAKPSKWSKMKIWDEYKGTREREKGIFNVLEV